MGYLEFEKTFRSFGVFSVTDIRKRFRTFDGRRLLEWQKKGYLIKIKRGYYCFEEQTKDEHFLHFAANRIYTPSYISLESALAFYGLIPEGVFTTVSVTTRNTSKYRTTVGNFEYRHIKPSLFFGYRLLQKDGRTIRIAEPEKVILDHLYLNKLNNMDAIEAMRFNEVAVSEMLDLAKLKAYQKQFSSRILDKRIRLFLKTTHA